MEKRDLNRLNHMLDAARTVCQHVADKKQTDLEEDRLLLGGVIRELLLIGEAANAVSPQAKANIPVIPWKKIIGMRNQLVHGYFEISYRIVWITVTEEIPQLIAELEKALSSAD